MHNIPHLRVDLFQSPQMFRDMHHIFPCHSVLKAMVTCAIFSLLFLPSLVHGQSKFSIADSLYNYWVEEDPERAKVFLGTQAQVMQSNRDRVQYNINQSDWHTKASRLDSAIYYSYTAENLASDSTDLGTILIGRSRVFLLQNRPDSARKCLRQAAVFMPHATQPSQFKAIYNLATSYQKSGKFDSAHKYIRMTFASVDLASQEDREKQLAYANQIMGMYFFRTSVYDSALTYLLQAADGFHVLGNAKGESESMDAIGGVFMFQEKFASALPYYRKAIAIAHRTKSKMNEANFLHNIGLTFKGLEEIDSAKTYFTNALELAFANKQIRLQANCVGNIGGLLLDENDGKGALPYFQDSRALFGEINNPVGICLSEMGIGQAYTLVNNHEMALIHLQNSKRIADQLPILQIKQECLMALYSYYDKLPNTDSALHYYVQYTEITDSIQGTEVRTRIEQLQIEYETRLKEEENLRLNSELDYEQEKNRISRVRFLFLIGFVISVVVGLGAVFYFFSKAKRLRILLLQEQLEKEEGQRQQIKANLESAQNIIVQKNQLLTKLENDIQYSTTMHQLADKLHERINTQGDWMQFMVEFDLVHPGYFDRLKQRVPNLSPNDLRIAALMRLQLSSKEMAEVLLITQEGVKKAKSRLKKKLNLSAEERLSQYTSNL